MIIKGEREIKRGNNISRRVFNQKFDLPSGAEVDKITSDYKLDGKLIVSIPQIQKEQPGQPKVETTSSSSHEKKVLDDGTVVEMSSSSTRKTSSSNQEMTIPISFGEISNKMAKTPRPRMMPFAFPELPEFAEHLMPSIPVMPSATDMMAQMQAQMQVQMQAQMAQMQQIHQQMPSMISMGAPAGFPSMGGELSERLNSF